jgi:hypothetical protein
MPSNRRSNPPRDRSGSGSSGETTGALADLARGAIALSIRSYLLHKERKGHDGDNVPEPRSSTKTRATGNSSQGSHSSYSDPPGAWPRTKERSLPERSTGRGTDHTRGKHDEYSDDHHEAAKLLTNVVVGVAALLARRYIRDRFTGKKRGKDGQTLDSGSTGEQTNHRPKSYLSRSGGQNENRRDREHGSQTTGRTSVQTETSAALEALTSEVRAASRSIRDLAAQEQDLEQGRGGQAKMEARRKLLRSADKLEDSLRNIETSANNIRNLGVEYPGTSGRDEELQPERRLPGRAWEDSEGDDKDWRDRRPNRARDRSTERPRRRLRREDDNRWNDRPRGGSDGGEYRYAKEPASQRR